MMVQTRQAFGASWICAKHSCPQASFSGQREHSLSVSCSFPSVALKAAFPAATRTAAGLCVSGHETSLFPRNFRYVRRARRNSTITATAAATNNVIRIYFIGRSFLAPPPGPPGAYARTCALSATHENPITSETSFTELDPGGFSGPLPRSYNYIPGYPFGCDGAHF